jgi:hypothetical protein
VPLHPVAKSILSKQEKDFRKQFGRKPTRGDRIFFQALEKPHEHMQEAFKEAGLASGVDRAKVYASWKTGLIITTDRLDLFTDSELDEFRAAAEEYDQLVAKGIDPFNTDQPFPESINRKFVQLLQAVSKSPLTLASIIDRGVRRRLHEADFFQAIFASQALHFLKGYVSALRLDDFDGGF